MLFLKTWRTDLFKSLYLVSLSFKTWIRELINCKTGKLDKLNHTLSGSGTMSLAGRFPSRN